MVTNTSITLFHKRFNSTLGYDEWERKIIKYANWQGGKGASIDKGYERANDIKVWIPYDKNQDLPRTPISIGDILVKGIIRTDIAKQSDLTMDNYNITSVVDNNYGSQSLRHIYIGAK